jgi:hypothetical protein
MSLEGMGAAEKFSITLVLIFRSGCNVMVQSY